MNDIPVFMDKTLIKATYRLDDEKWDKLAPHLKIRGYDGVIPLYSKYEVAYEVGQRGWNES